MSSHDHKTNIITPSASLTISFGLLLLSHFHITPLRFVCHLALAFHSSLLLQISVTLTGLPFALRRPGNLPKVIIAIATRWRIPNFILMNNHCIS
jgi:hypothetical protein